MRYQFTDGLYGKYKKQGFTYKLWVPEGEDVHTFLKEFKLDAYKHMEQMKILCNLNTSQVKAHYKGVLDRITDCVKEAKTMPRPRTENDNATPEDLARLNKEAEDLEENTIIQWTDYLLRLKVHENLDFVVHLYFFALMNCVGVAPEEPEDADGLYEVRKVGQDSSGADVMGIFVIKEEDEDK